MKIVQINSVVNGSTGNIMLNIHKELLDKGHESYIIWGRGKHSKNKNEICMGNKLDTILHALYSRFTGKVGFGSKITTKKILKSIDEIKPDIIHLHNIHGYYINIDMLFNYIKKKNIKIIWTLHDCWPITGHCAHFTYAKCDKWKDECNNCPQIHEYPKSLIDTSKWCYKKKKELFTGVEHLNIITPSEWLANVVKQSFLKNYNIDVIPNGVNTMIFKKNNSKFKEKYGIQSKHIVLGVSSIWNEKKGINTFFNLAKVIDNNIQLVMVGLTDKQIKKLPKNIIGIKKTNNVQELVEIYNAADVFLNTSVEETFSLVTAEAMACGTPCIVLNSTATPELIKNNNGIIVETDEINEILNDINLIINSEKDTYRLRSLSNSKKYTLSNYQKYLEIYSNIYGEN